MAAETAIQKNQTRPIEISETQTRRSAWTYRPNVDIFDSPECLLLFADVPGVDPETVDVTMESGILTIQADVQPRHRQQMRVLSHEYGVGNYHRRFEIDETIDTDQVTAEYREGTLKITLPKAQQARRRRIPVTS